MLLCSFPKRNTSYFFYIPNSGVPRLTVDSGAVEERRHQILMRTEAAKHQTDPIQRSQHEQSEGQQETAMVCLSHTAVYPTAPQHAPHRHTRQFIGNHRTVISSVRTVYSDPKCATNLLCSFNK